MARKPVSETNSGDGEAPPTVTQEVQETPSKTDEEPVSEGTEETPEQEESSKATEEPQPTVEDSQRELRAAREAQAAADRRANEYERQINENAVAEANRQREARKVELQRLKETDPDRYIAEREREDEWNEQAQRSWHDYESRVLQTARQNVGVYFPDLSPGEFDAAADEIDRLARSQAGRPANALEVVAMAGEHRVRKAAKEVETLRVKVKEQEQAIAALKGNRTADIVENGDGPEAPVTAGASRRYTVAQLKKMTREELMAIPRDVRDATMSGLA